MTEREALSVEDTLKLALAALDMVKTNADDWQERTGKEIKGWMQPVNNSITAIKEALAQPEQLEGLQLIHKADIDLANKRATEAQPEQEPVAWMNDEMDCIFFDAERPEPFDFDFWKPLYTTPPQRKPLTDEPAVWSLNVDELAIYRDGKRFAELNEGNSNDSWREVLRAGSELVQLLNAAHGIKE